MAKANNNTVELFKVQPSQIAEIDNLKMEVVKTVKENPFIKITDSKTYKAAVASRKALRDVSLKVEKEDGAIATFIRGFRDNIKTILVGEKGINKLSRVPFEKQDAEVKRYEAELEKAKELAAAEAAKEREAKIGEINEIIEGIKTKIESITYESHEVDGVEVDKMIKERKGTFGIYDVYFDTQISTLYDLLKEKINTVENENIEKENQRKLEIENQLSNVESMVKDLILKATFETIDETFVSINEIMTAPFNYMEYESQFETKSDELLDLWKRQLKTIKDQKELADLRAENTYNSRSEILMEIGMEKRENGDFYVHDLEYFKTSILSDSDEYFERTVDNIKRFIAGENAKPTIQLDNDDESQPTIEKINQTNDHGTDAILFAVEAITQGPGPENHKPDYVAMAEQKLKSQSEAETESQAENMGGHSAFSGAMEIMQSESQPESIGVATNIGEMLDLMATMNHESQFAFPIELFVYDGKIYFQLKQ